MTRVTLARWLDRALAPEAFAHRSLLVPLAMVTVLAVQGYRAFSVSVVIVVLPYVVALVLFARNDRDRRRTLDDATRTRLLLLLGMQALHSAEELLFGMPVAMPLLFGDILGTPEADVLAWPLPEAQLGSFSMIAFWSFAIALHGRRTVIFSFGVYMFVVSMCANAVFHPLYEAYLLASSSLAHAMRDRGLSTLYFPGLVTSPILGALAFPLLRRLRAPA